MNSSNPLSTSTTSTAIMEDYPYNWVEVDENLHYKCLKCGNVVSVMLKDEAGNLYQKKRDELVNDLETLPDDVISVFCPECGTEYELKLSDRRLFAVFVQ